MIKLNKKIRVYGYGVSFFDNYYQEFVRKLQENNSKLGYSKSMINGENMSVVGIVKCKDGILTFSDSKSTNLETFSTQIGRECIPKIFFNNKTVVCNFGKNYISKQNIEDVVPPILKDNIVVDDFASQFDDMVQKAVEYSCEDIIYHFLVYDLYNQSIKIVDFTKGKKPHYSKDCFCYALGGNEYYVGVFDEIFTKIGKDKGFFEYKTSELVQIVKDNLTQVIKTLDTLPFNNPCGFPIACHEFEISFKNCDKTLIHK